MISNWHHTKRCIKQKNSWSNIAHENKKHAIQLKKSAQQTYYFQLKKQNWNDNNLNKQMKWKLIIIFKKKQAKELNLTKKLKKEF